MSNRRAYKINITINNHLIKEVIIDSHYELKHAATINDDVILKLVQLLDNGDFEADSIDDGFEYYTTDGLHLNGKTYKLVWLLDEDKLFIGIVNAYRR